MREKSSPRDTVHALVLEDDAADAKLTIQALNRVGLAVRTTIATNAEEFKRHLDQGSFDLVLADYRLPGYSGMDALAEIKSRQLDLPLIVITGTLGDELAVECVKQGASDYILKNNLKRLPIAVLRALEEYRLRRERDRIGETVHKLTMAVDQGSAAVLITDLDGIIEYVNRRFVEISGYEAHEVIGQSPTILKSGLTPASVYRELWSTIHGGQVWRGELQNRRKNGELYWDSTSVSPIRDVKGTITNYLAIQEDITARRAVEQVLRDREERLRQITDNIKEVFFIVDAGYQEMLYISPAYEQVWGRSAQSLYDNPNSFLEGIHPEDRQLLAENITRLQRGENTGELGFRVVRPDGEVRWVLSTAVPIRNAEGEIYRIGGVAIDITERRLVEAALAESEGLLRKLTETSFDGIEIAVDGVVQEVNQGLADMLGYTVEEIVGRPVIDFVAEESLQDVKSRTQAGTEGTYELVAQRKDGKKVYLEATARAHTLNGRPARVTALRDVTEKRKLEEQLRHAQKMEAVGRLAGGVAHDFNNLLTVITTSAHFVLDDLAAEDPRRQDIEEIQKAATGATALTRQLLAFSRQQVTQPRRIHLEESVASFERMLRRLIGEDVEVNTVLGPSTTTIKIDPGQLEQVIMNLALNARDAMPNGGKLTIGTSTVELDGEEIEGGHLPVSPGRYALITVSDNGTGMDPATMARIFDPFFTTKPAGKGTGLGLSTVHGIVQQNGGSIGVYSEVGVGTTFKILLPVMEGSSKDELRAESGASLGGNETILIVEDAQAVRAAAKRALESRGYRVLDASDGVAALELAQQHPGKIDLLLTDVIMPEMGGRELAEQLQSKLPGLLVLFMSGYTDDAIVRHGVLDEGISYLEKPFSPDILAKKVRDTLDR